MGELRANSCCVLGRRPTSKTAHTRTYLTAARHFGMEKIILIKPARSPPDLQCIRIEMTANAVPIAWRLIQAIATATEKH